MIIVGLTCVFLLVMSTLIHYEMLRQLTIRLPGLRVPPRTKLIAVIFSAFLAHGTEILLYGLVVFACIHFANVGTLGGPGGPTLENCMYLSAETYSSLGFGDVVPLGPIRLVAGMEALNGLLLIGWTTSFAYIAMARFWDAKDDE